MDEIAQRARRATERILEDERLTDNLEDEAAQALIGWGIALAESIAHETFDEQTMQDRLQAVRRLMRYVNQWLPRRSEEGAESTREHLSKVLEQAAVAYGEQAYATPEPDSQGSFLRQFAAPATPPMQAIGALRALIEKRYPDPSKRKDLASKSAFSEKRMITVQAKLFATLRRQYPHLGIGEPMPVELEDGATVGDLVSQLNLPENQIKVVFVNGIVRDSDHPLADGDEVGIFPPVGGG